ncbi:metal ABC transporter substrate-binding protein [Verrucomicrobia bacterium LW23]|nr:metal ABC transporter substrate-binding protein [Verrucomicrobia bacterium LW23]
MPSSTLSPRPRRILAPALALAAALGILIAAIACLLPSPSATAADDSAKKKKIITTFTILQDIAQNVAGDLAVVESITRPGAEIHEYEPTPQDLMKVQSADLVLWNGLGLERWFERFFTRVKNVPSVVVTEGIEPMGIAEGPYNGKPNPHSWMSPANAIIYVENIRKALVKLDPANEAGYNANAAAYTQKLKAIDEPVRKKLGEIPVEQRWLVSSEGAFSYLIRNYEMKELYLWPVNADEEGTPRQVRKVIDTVRKNKIPVVFAESTISDKAMKQVAKETGTRFGGTLYVDSLTDASGPAPTYLKMLEYNAETIVKGFTGK